MGASTIGSVCRPPAADRRIAGERCSAIRSRRVDRRCGRARAWRDSGNGQSAERRHRTTPRVWAARGDRATERHRRSGPSRHSMARRTHALAGRPAAPAFPRRRPPCRRGRRAPARRIAIRVHPGGVCRQGGCRLRTPIATHRSHDLSCGRAKIRHLDGPRGQPGSSARTRHGCCASRRRRSLANTCARRSATRGFRRAAEGRTKFRHPVAASYCVTGEHAFHQLGNGRCGARSTVLLECRIERLHECIRSGVGDRYNEP